MEVFVACVIEHEKLFGGKAIQGWRYVSGHFPASQYRTMNGGPKTYVILCLVYRRGMKKGERFVE
jgi:hypothetical protein